MHLRGEDGAWAASEIELASDPDWWAGGHGLYSTPHDYLKFQRMLLGNGTSPDGVRSSLPRPSMRRSPTRSASWTSPRTSRPPIRPRRSASRSGPGTSGVTACCSTPTTSRAAGRAGTGAWAGLLNTHYWVDRSAGITGAIYSQFLPFIPPRRCSSTPTSRPPCTRRGSRPWFRPPRIGRRPVRLTTRTGQVRSCPCPCAS